MRDVTLTRRHFELIANVINIMRVDKETRRTVAYEFVHTLESSNKNFSTVLFIAAALKDDMRREKAKAKGEEQRKINLNATPPEAEIA